ncbi:MAG: MFS transporter [Acidimicrobiia bacterium]
MSTIRGNAGRGGIKFHHPAAFWLGATGLVAGTLLHLPMYLGAADMGYRLAGMPIDGRMQLGMALIIGGLAASAYGLFPRVDPEARNRVARVRVRALDDAPLGRPHVVLLAVLAVAVLIDIMKPTTLGFVVPGMAEEYGLKSPLNPAGTIPVALLPLVGIAGTVMGSFLWGWLADRIGRRATILLAALMFIGTAICGAMPSFAWNLLMCFIMGLSVGGMLPIAYALTAETIPARHRGVLMILIGGDLSLAFFVTSWLSSSLQPEFGWRIMWLIGAPTGLLLILMSRWIPESPRFLLANGRREEAQRIMDRFGATIVEDEQDAELAVEETIESRFTQLLKRPFGGLSLGLGLYALAFGLVQFGFLLWLPTNLRKAGFDVASADFLVAKASLLGFPITFLVALLYGFWSSKKTMVMFASLTCATLFGFALLGEGVAENPLLLQALVVVVIMGVSTATTDLMPTYAAEVYPTRLRGRGSGFVAGASKAGGLLGIGLVVAAVTPPTFTGAALLGAVPMLLAIVAMAVYGVETRRRRLEEITADQLGT